MSKKNTDYCSWGKLIFDTSPYSTWFTIEWAEKTNSFLECLYKEDKSAYDDMVSKIMKKFSDNIKGFGNDAVYLSLTPNDVEWYSAEGCVAEFPYEIKEIRDGIVDIILKARARVAKKAVVRKLGADNPC